MSMTVSELIARLSEVDDLNQIVILQSDPEGNSFRTLSGIDITSIRATHRSYFTDIDCDDDDAVDAILLFP